MSAMAASAQHTELVPLLDAMYTRYGYDFRQYSSSCLVRRLSLACSALGCKTLSELRDRLLEDPSVLSRVVSYATVQVTEMFRDPAFFRALREQVVPHLRTYPSVRVWVAGCSTGEELYSLAILLREEGLDRKTQFYATDINRVALETAKSGIYPLNRMSLYTRNHQQSGAKTSLSGYYTAGYEAAVFDKTLRERTVFADHSLVSDSVFAEVHLVVCRNVLIYFQRPLQNRAVSLFRDSLVRRGFLALGSNESLRFNAHYSAFSEFVRGQRIYRKGGDK